MPAENIEHTGEFVVKVDEKFRTREQVVATVIRRDLDGSFVTLEDVISSARAGHRRMGRNTTACYALS